MKFAAAALLSTMAIAADNTLPSPFDFQVKYAETKTFQKVIVMQLTMPNDSTMGINLGESMAGSDSIMCTVVGTGVVGCFDMTLPAEKDVKENILTVNVPEKEGLTKITLTRALETKDEADFVVPLDTDFTVSWTINDKSSKLSDEPTQTGTGLKLNIPSTGEQTSFMSINGASSMLASAGVAMALLAVSF